METVAAGSIPIPVCLCEDISVVSGVRRRRMTGERDEADRRRIPDTTPWTKPPWFGRTIALWELYSAYIAGCSRWTEPANEIVERDHHPQSYRRLRCTAIVLTNYTWFPETLIW